MSYFFTEVTWPPEVTNVEVNGQPVAAGELISCSHHLVLTWSKAGVLDSASGQIETKPQRRVVWVDDAVVPVQLRPVAIGTQVLNGRYRRRDTEVARWRLPVANPVTNRWLIHPGAMTGDLWHIVAALNLDQNLQLVVVWNRANEQDSRNAQALLDLVGSLDISADRVIRATVNLAPNASISNAQARNEGVQRVRRSHEPPLVGHTWASTSVVVEQAFVDRYDPARVQQRLSQAFTNAREASDQFRALKADYDGYALNWLETLKQDTHYVLVNMRWTGLNGQNPQHNITQDRFNQIVATAKVCTDAKQPTQVIRIGRPELRDQTNCGWAADAAGTLGVDIFCDNVTTAELHTLNEAIWTNKLFHAYFWQQVASRAAETGTRIGLIGGRSGGMDIASFMGVRSASWDRPSADDQHYMRLHWAAPYNSIIRDQNGMLDEGALEHWMQGGELVPLINGDPIPGTVIGTKEQYAGDNQAFNALWYPPYQQH